MNVTPLDLRNQQFRSVMRGFDRDEVLAFLAEASDDYAAALREADQLRQEVARLDGVVNEHRDNEKNLRNTLLTVQRLADEIRDNAHQQAAQIVKDAESRANLVLDKAHSRYEDVQREIDGLRLKRREVENSVESIITALRNTLDFVREQDTRDREEKILIHRPRTIDIREASVWTHDRPEDKTAERA
jgi:cell division initiation protein